MSNIKTSITGWGFPPGFGKNGSSVEMVSGEEDIRQSLEIILSTAVNERLNYPDFGCDLNAYMFAEVNNSLIMEIEDMILESVGRYETRVDVVNIEISQSEDWSGATIIHLEYYINEYEILQNMEFSFYSF